ncbi:MAG: hypothetical protein ABL974_09620 [Prosthecobacter sp.]
MKLLFVSTCLISITLLCSQEKPALQPLVESHTPELALLMGDLQRLTHKLALSADAGNTELAAFYLHESQEQLRKIQSEAPEYENLPVALLIDRMAHPAYSPMQEAVVAKDKERMLAGIDSIIQSCNACHTATQHAFIRITPGTEVNPFNQSFAP